MINEEIQRKPYSYGVYKWWLGTYAMHSYAVVAHSFNSRVGDCIFLVFISYRPSVSMIDTLSSSLDCRPFCWHVDRKRLTATECMKHNWLQKITRAQTTRHLSKKFHVKFFARRKWKVRYGRNSDSCYSSCSSYAYSSCSGVVQPIRFVNAFVWHKLWEWVVPCHITSTYIRYILLLLHINTRQVQFATGSTW